MGINIVCVYNKKDIYERDLLRTLFQQNYRDWTLIPVDNTENKYRGLIEAVNSVENELIEDTTIILHQDIVFEQSNVLEAIIKQIDYIDEYGVLGVAGSPAREKERGSTVSNIFQGEDHSYASPNHLNEMYKCETVDECLFIIKTKNLKQWIKKLVLIQSWHLYATELCIISKNAKLSVITLPVCGIYHESPGVSISRQYYDSLKKLFDEYQSEKVLYTSMGKWARGYSLFIRYQYIEFKMKMKRYKDKLIATKDNKI